MRILMIEDDQDLCQAVSFALEKDGYSIDVCNEGDDGLRTIRQRAHDFILLDRMLPRVNGIDILRTARREGITTPVLMITGMGKSEDMIEGLDYGADDYIVKPFVVDELLARIRAMRRRPRTWETTDNIEYKQMVLEPARKTLHNGRKKITLSKRECALMEIFFKNIGTALPRTTLLTHVWGKDAIIEEGILDNYISFLRRRLKTVDSPLGISTIRGSGYVLEDMDEEQ